MKTFVIIPTYNEKENIGILIKEILDLNIENLKIVVVDDNSPDGTWKIVKDISKKNKKVILLLRKGERGRGLAGKEGFKYVLDNKADYIIEMDADFSHNPQYIPNLLKEIKYSDVVLGSRRIKGGKEKGRGLARRAITRLANFYIRLLLGLNIKDCNSGFRCFRREVLEKIEIDKINSKGPSIIQEILFKAHMKGFKIKEILIVFEDRKKGASKLGIRQLAQGYFMVLRLKLLSLRSFFFFLIGGGFGAIINILITAFMTEVYLISYKLSYIVGLAVNLVFNFLFNRYITFSAKSEWQKRFIKFFIVSISTILLNYGLVVLLTDMFKIYYLFSIIFVVAIISVLNYKLNKLWVFKNDDK